ncbi:MAG: SdrD B-like domain-containing protein [Fuerstiella sp.]
MAVRSLLDGVFRRSSRSTHRRKAGRQAWSAVRMEALEVRSLLTSLIGAEITVSNTYQSAAVTGGLEVPQGQPQRVLVEQSSDDPELTQFQGLYNIDIDGDRIAMVYNLSPNYGSDPARVLELGTFDRYYFDVEGLAPDEFISSVVAEPTRNLVPNVSLVDADTILVEIGPGMQIGNNFNALILVDVEQAPRSIDGETFTVSHTVQSTLGTSGIEVPQGTPVTGTVADGSPQVVTAGSYRFFVESESIGMAFNATAVPGQNPSQIVEAGSFDRYYFEFDLGTNEFISSATASLQAALVPTVSIVGQNTIVVEVGPGMQVGNGFDALINFDVDVVGSEVSGRKWNDLNNDGLRSGNEPWLNGWEMQLLDPPGNVVATTITRNVDLDDNGLIDPATEMGVYIFEGVQNGSYVVEEVLKQSWIQSHPISPIAQLAFETDRNLQLQAPANTFLNWGGLNEKWLYGAGLWYYITPDGLFYRWNGSPRTALSGDLVAEFNSTVYNNPALLHSAPAPVPNTVEVSVPDPVAGRHFGNFLAPPQFQISPDAAGNNVTFDWNEASSDSRYEIWITDINTRRRFEVTTGIVGNTYTTNLPDRSYRVWMRTEYSPGVFSAWSSSQTFEFFRAPIDPIVAGLDAGIDATPTIRWTTQTDAVSYDVRVINSTGAVTYLAQRVAGTSHRIAKPQQLGTHRVAVRANYSDGSRSEWSSGQTLTIIGRPQVLVDGQVVSWTAVKAATDYEVWVDRVDAEGRRLQRQVVYANDIKTLNFQLPNPANGRYAVWVRAIRAEAGEQYVSFWSPKVDLQVSASDADTGPLEAATTDLMLVSIRPERRTLPPQQSGSRISNTVHTQPDEEVQAAAEEQLMNAVMAQRAGRYSLRVRTFQLTDVGETRSRWSERVDVEVSAVSNLVTVFSEQVGVLLNGLDRL